MGTGVDRLPYPPDMVERWAWGDEGEAEQRAVAAHMAADDLRKAGFHQEYVAWLLFSAGMGFAQAMVSRAGSREAWGRRYRHGLV